ncbi:MAG: prepilin-type N-terminal cleavage/methylation domain-containing protein [Sulfurovum sp.]|nr:prepilin-type N-terminal cleavage/methylation domain-containing protein [Sulfurovum sp.]
MPKYKKTQQAFTLIELLIVILIVSLVYFLGFSGVEIHKSKPKALTPLNLKTLILDSPEYAGKASLLCLNKCTICLIRPDINSPYKEYEGTLALGNIKAYVLDRDDILEDIEYERYDDQPICLKMDFYPNGSSTQIILENETGTYFLPAHLEAVKTFDSTSDARTYWLEGAQLVSDQGDYY